MTLYCSHTSAALACSTVSAALKDTSFALALWALSVNVSKTVAMVIAPHSSSMPRFPNRRAAFATWQDEEVELVSQTRLLLSRDYHGREPFQVTLRGLNLHWESRPQNQLVLHDVRAGNWPLWQEDSFSSQWFSQIWSVQLQQPSRSCRLVNKINYWRSGERPFDAWQVYSLKMTFYHQWEI